MIRIDIKWKVYEIVDTHLKFVSDGYDIGASISKAIVALSPWMFPRNLWIRRLTLACQCIVLPHIYRFIIHLIQNAVMLVVTVLLHPLLVVVNRQIPCFALCCIHMPKTIFDAKFWNEDVFIFLYFYKSIYSPPQFMFNLVNFVLECYFFLWYCCQMAFCFLTTVGKKMIGQGWV